MKNYNVIIMRGLPGAGKSKFRSDFSGFNKKVFSADDFYMKDGVYKFDASLQHEAHMWCFKCFQFYIKAPCPDREYLFIDNTNIRAWEIAPYYTLAEASEYVESVQIVTILCDLATSMAKNIHDVPNNVIFEMYQNLMNEKLPPHWNHAIVSTEKFN